MTRVSLSKLGNSQLFAAPAVLSSALGTHGHAAEVKGSTLTIAADHDAYIANEMGLLADQVREAAGSQQARIELGSSASGVTVTIYDLARDARFVDVVETHFAGRPQFSIKKIAAESVRISFLSEFLKSRDREKIARESDGLADFVKGLRPLPPGVRVEPRPDGAIVRSDDPSFGDRIVKELGTILVFTSTGKTTWHIGLNSKSVAILSPLRKLRETQSMELILRSFVGSPDLQTNPTGEGIVVTISDPQRHQDFVGIVKRTFAENRDFIVKDSPALILNIADADIKSHDLNCPSAGSPRRSPNVEVWDALHVELEELVNPSVEIAVVGDTVSFKAKDAAHNADRAAIARQALANRNDLVITSMSDQSLVFRLAPGTHLGRPEQPLKPGELATAVQARATALHLSSPKILWDDTDRLEARFASDAEATAFQNNLSERFGFAIRLVDDPKTQTDASPYLGDVLVPAGEGPSLWLRPEAVITGGMVADASVGKDDLGTPNIHFRLTEEGRTRFANATRENIGRRFAIVLNGVVQTAPIINVPIEGGQGQITGKWTIVARLPQSDRFLAINTLLTAFRGETLAGENR